MNTLVWIYAYEKYTRTYKIYQNVTQEKKEGRGHGTASRNFTTYKESKQLKSYSDNTKMHVWNINIV